MTRVSLCILQIMQSKLATSINSIQMHLVALLILWRNYIPAVMHHMEICDTVFSLTTYILQIYSAFQSCPWSMHWTRWRIMSLILKKENTNAALLHLQRRLYSPILFCGEAWWDFNNSATLLWVAWRALSGFAMSTSNTLYRFATRLKQDFHWPRSTWLRYCSFAYASHSLRSNELESSRMISTNALAYLSSKLEELTLCPTAKNTTNVTSFEDMISPLVPRLRFLMAGLSDCNFWDLRTFNLPIHGSRPSSQLSVFLSHSLRHLSSKTAVASTSKSNASKSNASTIFYLITICKCTGVNQFFTFLHCRNSQISRTWQSRSPQRFCKGLLCLSTIWCKTCWQGKMRHPPDNVFHSKPVTACIPHYQYTDFTLLALSRTIKRSYQEWLNQISGHSNSSWTIVTSLTSPEARAIYVWRTCIQFEWSVRLVSMVKCSVASDCTPFKRRQMLCGT